MLSFNGVRGVISNRSFNLRFKSSIASLVPTIKELFEVPPKVNSLVSTQGHIKSIRQFKNVGFVDLSDGSFHQNLSIILHQPEEVLSVLQLKVGQSISVEGTWVESKGKQSYELLYSPKDESNSMKIIGDVPESYPIQKKFQTYQFLRTLPTLRHRTSSLASMLRLRSFIETKMIDFFDKKNFVKVAPPLITSSDCEGAGEQFRVEPMNERQVSANGKIENFFGKPAYLAVSTQLHLEALAMSLNRVWTLTPCFRAELSNTNRHLSEFWMLEAEICYVTEIKQLTDFAEEMIRFVTKSFKESANSFEAGNSADILGSRFKKEELNAIKSRWECILTDSPWPSITYKEALDIINEPKNKQSHLTWGESIQTEHEKWLAGSYFKSPIFITDYPVSEKPFYMPRSKNFDSTKPTVACFDLIIPEMGELIGGSLREHDYDSLIEAMKERNMNIEDMEWYLSTRLNGSVPHGGFGMGFERLLSYLSAMDNLKDVNPFPRVPQSCPC